MTKDEAIELLRKKVKNENLQKHCLAVGAVMRALAERYGGNQDEWEIAGILHDIDYEQVKDNAKKLHTKKALEWLSEYDLPQSVLDAIARHAWGYVEGAPEPQSSMDWALYCCDELTGLIIAVALVKPERKLSAVGLDSIKNKWGQKSFASGVNREQIKMCEEKLNLDLDELIEDSIKAMQGISGQLGL